MLLDRLRGLEDQPVRFGFGDYLKLITQFTYNGIGYTVPQTYQSQSGDEGVVTLEAQAVGAYAGSAVVFACMRARMDVFAQVRYQFQQLRDGRPGDLFGNPSLSSLERPWVGGTTANLNTRLMVFGDLTGNAYVTRSSRGDLRLLRPDWTTIIAGGDDIDGVDAVPVGYIYQPGGPGSGKTPVPLLAKDVAHFAPYPDPLRNWLGMSWLTPAVRHVQGHKAATEHKLKFFDHGGTPNMIVKVDPSTSFDVFKAFKESFIAEYLGSENAYKVWFLGGGADATVVGSTFEQMSFKDIQSIDETVICAAAGVPLSMVGLGGAATSGSSLNSGNYGEAKRQFADTTIQHLAMEAAASLETLIPAPSGSRLWFDTRDIAFFRDDAKDEAEIHFKNAQSIRQYIEAGFDPDAAVSMVMTGDLKALLGAHTGLTSVQLQPPDDGSEEPVPDEAA